MEIKNFKNVIQNITFEQYKVLVLIGMNKHFHVMGMN
jgi:hypothetical protein